MSALPSTASEANRNMRKVESLTTLTMENTNIFLSSKYVNPNTVYFPFNVRAFPFIHVPENENLPPIKSYIKIILKYSPDKVHSSRLLFE